MQTFARTRPRALMGLYFFPRGGSAHVAENLARALPKAGWDVRVVSGSIDRPGRPGDARRFYAGVDVHPVDMTAALDAPDPVLARTPLHGSFEDRPGAPDRILASMDDDAFEHHADVWERALFGAGARDADVLHLHHLTPINEAAARVAPDVPVIGHIHGTELLMLEAIERGADWPHAEAWAERMRGWAQACEALVLLSDTQVERVEDLLGVDAERCVVVPNGFDPETFHPQPVERLAHWHRHLVADPQGWGPGQDPGEVRYTERDLAAFTAEGPVLLYVGRFTEVKLIPLLIDAYARARESFAHRAPLVILGGFPGEWEGEHPLESVRRNGVADVFLAGWHGHDELPGFLNASDVVVLPSVREQFGQVLVEGMACGRPTIAVDAHGPSEIVTPGETGWLVAGDDSEQLAAALVEAVNAPAERRRRGVAARADAERRFAWPALAERVAAVYEAAFHAVR
jgi:glycosyltransferase involved in cell wall biosynthesis